MLVSPTVPPPNNVSAYPLSDPGTIRVTWTPPSTTHGLDVIEYLVQYKDKDAETYREQRLRTPTTVGNVISLDVCGLQLGNKYDVQVVAVTTEGVGTYSQPIDVTTYKGMLLWCVYIQLLPGHVLFYQLYHMFLSLVLSLSVCSAECLSNQSTIFATFNSDSMTVSESMTRLHIDVFRYGQMEEPLTLSVTDEPVTAKRCE